MQPLLSPLQATPEPHCPLHLLRPGAWVCTRCGRGHCDECKRRTTRRLTPPGTCLECGGTLIAHAETVETPGWAGVLRAWRHAYSPLGLASAAAIALPLLYGGFVVTMLVPGVAITGFCAWTYFLAVVRWRVTGNPDLPVPARALHDVRSAMAVLGTFLATLLAATPAALAATHVPDRSLSATMALGGLLWLPLPVLAGVASNQQLSPLVPVRVIRAAVRDAAGFSFMTATAAAGWLLIATGVGLLGQRLVHIPMIGPWLTCVLFLPGAWAIGLIVGGWGRKHLDELAVEP